MDTDVQLPAPVPNLQLDQLCEHLERTATESPELLCDFAREFVGKATRQVAQERSLEDQAAMTVGAFRFVQRSRPDRVNVEVLNPEEEGWSAPVTVIRTSVGDRPFVVDTIREYLSAEGLVIHRFIHPVLGVERDRAGELVRVGDLDIGQPEALVHCEVSRLVEPERREAVRQAVASRLGDVVAATDDFQAMLAELKESVEMVRGYGRRLPDRSGEFREIEEFLRWIKDGNFVLLGYRAYDIRGEGEQATLEVEHGSGLGILRTEGRSAWAEPVPLESISEELRRRVLGPMLIISKTNAESTVHRRARMDYIGVKKLDDDARVVGERRFLGLFTSKAYAEHADVIPILRDKLEAILRRSGAPPGSHDYKEIITIFNSLPKEELFQASIAELLVEVQTVLNFLFADQVQVTLRPDPLGRGVSTMVILPRGRFSGDVRQRIQEALVRRFQGTVLNYHLAMSAGDQARLHFYLSAPPELVRRVQAGELEADIRQIIRTWEDRLRDELAKVADEAEAQRLADLYCPAFSDEYRAATSPGMAVSDVLELERMRAAGKTVAISLREPPAGERAEAYDGATLLNLYLLGERLVLSDFMPTLDHSGVRVADVTPFAVAAPGLPEVMIYSFTAQNADGAPIPLERADLLAEMLLAVREGDASDDPYNALVLASGLRWREVDVLRAYGNYAFQIQAVPTRFGTARALTRYPEIARLLVELFRVRFDPAARGAPSPLAGINRALEKVVTLADDRAIRRMVGLIDGTTRTNYYRHGGADPVRRSGGVPYLSLKFHSADVEELRRTRLLYEVFVFSARMEGIHLRAAPVSRGGIRWSDRPDDFRTEVMGLVQTQIVKNAVIVPSGSKGGFITKRHFADREAALREAAEQYRTLMRGLLDLTDNLVGGQVVPPEGVVRYDGDDPYLVVAADKGTAHLSDVANEISAEYGFWLGDAFASGGSQGYDHKKEGITARGAWESVRRHFREMGVDIEREPFTVVGIGDMSGDVFGNGMLLSRQIRLLAAFDHRHIFIDPDPDPEVSFRERERLFALPRSSWEDYDRSLLAPGAMVVPRGSKEVALTSEARRALGIDESIDRMDGEALVRAVLTAPAGLLWNGGIGTYVKAAEETHAEVGDSTNDPVRVDAEELRCQVVGEGGNLGFTQRARINYALRGGRINTDALDNSGGVDMSDHEVNLKILLGPMVAEGKMAMEARNELLESMTDEVSRLVLQNNVGQSLAISLDEARSRESLGDFAALVASFERERLLERGAEGIPGRDEIAERATLGIGLTRPTLCVLLAYAKLHAGARLLASQLPDDAAMEQYLASYFPAAAVQAVGVQRLREHRLRREIITTTLVSDLVNLMGASFLFRVARDGGQEIDEVVWAWDIASRMAGAAEIREDLARLEGTFPSETVYRWLFALARVLERTTRWVLNNVEPGAPSVAVLAEHLSGLSRLRADFRRIVSGEHRDIFVERMAELQELGVDEELSARLITLRFLPELLDIMRIARESGTDEVATAEAYYLVAEHLAIPWLQQSIRAVVREQHWDKRLSQALLADVGRAHRSVARRVLGCEVHEGDMLRCIHDYENHHSRLADSYREVLEELRTAEQVPLAGYAVAVRTLVDLATE
jgi:glutamate dehydrogenase